MPYIGSDRRQAALQAPDTPGELNYAMCKLALDYVRRKGVCYTSMGDVAGAFNYANLEFYRRVVVPYEIEATERNGDVFI